jgi:hypothetical protein
MRTRLALVSLCLSLAVPCACDSASDKKVEMDCDALGKKMTEIVPEQMRQGFSMIYKGSCEKGNLDPKLYECLMAAKDYDTMSQCDQ